MSTNTTRGQGYGDTRYQTPAETRHNDEETEADESDADDGGGRVDSEGQRYDERNAADDRQTAADAYKHERRRLESDGRPDA